MTCSEQLIAPRAHWVPGLRQRLLDGETPRLSRSALISRPRARRSLAGSLCPNARLADGRRLDEVTRSGFVLVSAVPLTPHQRALLEARGAQAIEVEAGSALHAWLSGGGATAALVRPDLTVMRAGRDVAALCEAVPRFQVAGPADVTAIDENHAGRASGGIGAFQDESLTTMESETMNLATNLARSAHAHADRVAVRLGEQKTTYRALDERSRRVAGLLAERGVRAGDRVAIMLPNVPEFAAVYYGVLRAGAVVVPMNPLLKAREVAYYLADSGAAVIFAGPMSAAEVLAGAATAGAQVVVVDPHVRRDAVRPQPLSTRWSTGTARTRR